MFPTSHDYTSRWFLHCINCNSCGLSNTQTPHVSLIVKILNTWIVFSFLLHHTPEVWMWKHHTPLSPHFWSLCGENIQVIYPHPSPTTTALPILSILQSTPSGSNKQVVIYDKRKKKKKIIICCLKMLYLTHSILMPSFINIQLFKFSNTLKSFCRLFSHDI